MERIRGWGFRFSRLEKCRNVSLQEQENRIDLLLSDVVMPEMSGGELSRRLLRTNPAMKVLFMSGYIDEAALHQEIREKKRSFCKNPFLPEAWRRKSGKCSTAFRLPKAGPPAISEFWPDTLARY